MNSICFKTKLIVATRQQSLPQYNKISALCENEMSLNCTLHWYACKLQLSQWSEKKKLHTSLEICLNCISIVFDLNVININFFCSHCRFIHLFPDVEGKVPDHRITGQYRNKSNRIWDPHPQYLIDAFGVHLHLILYQDNSFIPKHMKVS